MGAVQFPTFEGLVTMWLLWESPLLGNSREGSYLWGIDAPVGRPGGRMTPFPVGNYWPGALRGHPHHANTDTFAPSSGRRYHLGRDLLINMCLVGGTQECQGNHNSLPEAIIYF